MILLKSQFFCKIKIYDFKTGRMLQSIDESINFYSDNQSLFSQISHLDYGHRLVIEKELLENQSLSKVRNVIFDPTSRYIIYSSLAGLVFYDLVAKKTLKTRPSITENIRLINLSFYDNSGKIMYDVEEMLSNNTDLQAKQIADPTIIATAFKKNR